MLSTLLLGQGKLSSTEANSADFDGVNDYLLRSSDLVGNTDGKAFTLSVWLYVKENSSLSYVVDLGGGFYLSRSSAGVFTVYGSLLGVEKLNVSFSNVPEVLDTFVNILVSVDLSNVLNRSVYMNDKAPSSVTWNTYVDSNIEFTKGSLGVSVGSSYLGASKFKGRISDLFMDYSFRDLSIESNRRDFITSDLRSPEKPSYSSPLIYLPMANSSIFFKNKGTGGDFIQNGIMASSQMGPSQWNCNSSYFPGAGGAHFLQGLTFPTTRKLTVSFTFTKLHGATNSGPVVLDVYSGPIQIGYIGVADNSFHITWDKDSFGALSFTFDWNPQLNPLENRVHIVFSFDMDVVGSEKLFYNGVDSGPPTSSTVTGFSAYQSDNLFLGRYTGALVYKNTIGEFYLDSSHQDPSVFYSKKSKPVRQVISETGHTPLIALPLSSNNLGENVGSLADFNSINPLYSRGERSQSEYWANSIIVDGSDYLTNAGIFCKSLVKWKSIDSGVTWVPSYLNNVTVTSIGNGTDNGMVAYYIGTEEDVNWSDESEVLRFTDAFGFPTVPEESNYIVLSLDFRDSTNYGKNKGTGTDFIITGTPAKGGDVNV